MPDAVTFAPICRDSHPISRYSPEPQFLSSDEGGPEKFVRHITIKEHIDTWTSTTTTDKVQVFPVYHG